MEDYQKARWVLVGAVLFILAVIAYKLHPRSTFAADGLSPRWDASVQQSQAAHMPSLVLFTADWCPVCRRLDDTVLSRPDIANEINGHYVMIAVDRTNCSPNALARQKTYGVYSFPTLIRFDANGKESDRTHYLPPDEMLAWLREGE